MFSTHTSATRQELLKLKDKLKSAARGYKLLKDKRDSLIQTFIESYREAVNLRKKTDQEYLDLRTRFDLSSSEISSQYMQNLAQTSQTSINIDSVVKNVMGVKIQELSFTSGGDLLNYSNLATNYHLDHSLTMLNKLLPDIMKLIEKEYKVRKLAEEIEKTRKRVNALEYIILPQIRNQIKYINSKLEELALQNTVRLMRIKEQITVS